MATTVTIIKYQMNNSSGVVGQQPFKKKAKFSELLGWKYVDKLNKLKEFVFTIPNDEFHRANAIVERKVFVPFIRPFRGFITKKSQDESGITLTAKEFATHLERRIFQVDGERRINVTTKDWFDGAWKFRRKLLINKELVDGDINNYPILVNISTNTGFKNHAQADGDDFVFTSKDGITVIPHEIEEYDSTTGQLTVWIKPLKISDVGDSIIFVYYGNDDVINQEDIVNVWKGLNVKDAGTAEVSNAYDAVWHLDINSLDSTENNNDGTDTAITRAAGQIADAAVFDLVNSKIDVGTGTTIDDTFDNNGWVSAWFNANTDGELSTGVILDKVTWTLSIQDEASGFVRLRFLHTWSGDDGTWDTAVNIPLNEPMKVDVVYDNSLTTNQPTIYINGVARTVALGTLTETTTPTSTRDSDAASNLIIGNLTGQTRTFDGEIDEVRVMKVAPPNTSSIIKTEYNNQNTPTDLITVFTQEQYIMSAREIAKQIIDSANTDQEAGVTWTLDDNFAGTIPTSFRIPTASLIAYISFEKSLKDHAGNNDGTEASGRITFIDGQIGKAANFDGFSHVTLANETNFDFERTDPFSIHFRFRNTSSSDQMLVGKRNGVTSSNTGWSVHTNSSGNIRFEIADGTNEFFAASSSGYNDGKWHTVVAAFDGSSNQSGMRIYIDGVLDGTGTDSAMSISILNNLAVSIGSRNDGTTVNYIGDLDEVRIYDVNLTLDSVKELDVLANNIFAGAFNFKNHYESLQIVGEVVQKDVFFDNKNHIVFMESKGKTLDSTQRLDLIITSKPETSVDDFANEINLLGKGTKENLQLENNTQVDTLLRFNYEKVVTDSQLGEAEQLTGVATNLLNEFQKLTPQVKGQIPYNQFIRLDLGTGDIIKISQPEKQLNASFRVMDIVADQSKAKISLESTDTGVVRLRSLNFSDVIEGILKRIQDQSIVSSA